MIVALPDQLFYNTGIHNYVWVLTNRWSARRRGKVQLINAVDLIDKLREYHRTLISAAVTGP